MSNGMSFGGRVGVGGGRRDARLAFRGQKRWKERMNEMLRVIRKVIREQLMATPTWTVTPRKITIRGHTGMGPHTGMGGMITRGSIYGSHSFYGLE